MPNGMPRCSLVKTFKIGRNFNQALMYDGIFRLISEYLCDYLSRFRDGWQQKKQTRLSGPALHFF